MPRTRLVSQWSAVTVTSPASAWAFEGSDSGRPSAYQLSGSTWKKRAFPGSSDEEIFSATASSASNVWAFTNTGAAVQFNGSRWSVVKTFPGGISSGRAISKTDVWVFGGYDRPAWHYNGSRWTQSASGEGLNGASALSPSSIWAYSMSGVAHWNGRTWKKTSLIKLVPKTPLGEPFVAGVYARSARSVYALGSEGGETVGGPLVLLQYNGTSWHRAVISKEAGGPVAIIPDGTGGLWIPVNIFILDGRMDRFVHGALATARLPISSAHLRLVGAAIAPHSTAAFAVGYERKSPSGVKRSLSVLMRSRSGPGRLADLSRWMADRPAARAPRTSIS